MSQKLRDLFDDLKKIYNIAIKTNLDDRSKAEKYCGDLYDMFNKVNGRIFTVLALMSELNYYDSIPYYLKVSNPSNQSNKKGRR